MKKRLKLLTFKICDQFQKNDKNKETKTILKPNIFEY